MTDEQLLGSKYNPKSLPVKLCKMLVAEDRCPACLGELDTGWECNDCDFDAQHFALKEDWPKGGTEAVQ